MAALRKELQLTDPKDRLILVSTTGQIHNILDEELPMPYNAYTVYSQPRTIAAYVVKPGALVMIENIAPNSYQRFVTYPLVVNYKQTLTRNNLLQHVTPIIQDRFWREVAKNRDQAASSKDSATSVSDYLKDIFVDNPKLAQVPMPADPNEVSVCVLGQLYVAFLGCRRQGVQIPADNCVPLERYGQLHPAKPI